MNSYEIPKAIYDRVYELVMTVVNAVEADDLVAKECGLAELRGYCEEQTALGHGSGFLWEALADLTDERDLRLAYYEKSLAFARSNQEPTQTVLYEIGLLHSEGGDWHLAEPFLLDARLQAIQRDDEETEGAAAALLIQMLPGAAHDE